MYDLEILIPAETNNKIIVRRLQDFKKWGLLNIQDNKIKLVLATSKDNDPSCLKTGWDKNIDVHILETPYTHVAQRIYYYYSSYAKANTARFYCKFDEDSMTNISSLINNLDKNFDHERDYYIVSEFGDGVEKVEEYILKTLGFDWYRINPNGTEDAPEHEYECCIVSNSAMNKILNNEKAKQYLNLRQEFADGAGDHGFAFCARMEKIYLTKVNWLTKDTNLVNFSIFDGLKDHIHWTGRDMNPVYNFLELIENNDRSKYNNQNFIFTRGEQTYWVKLRSEQTIELNPNDNNKYYVRLGLWGTTKEGKIALFMEDLSFVILDNLEFNEYKLKKIN